jgi:hypothetical protein
VTVPGLASPGDEVLAFLQCLGAQLSGARRHVDRRLADPTGQRSKLVAVRRAYQGARREPQSAPDQRR